GRLRRPARADAPPGCAGLTRGAAGRGPGEPELLRQQRLDGVDAAGPRGGLRRATLGPRNPVAGEQLRGRRDGRTARGDARRRPRRPLLLTTRSMSHVNPPSHARPRRAARARIRPAAALLLAGAVAACEGMLEVELPGQLVAEDLADPA